MLLPEQRLVGAGHHEVRGPGTLPPRHRTQDRRRGTSKQRIVLDRPVFCPNSDTRPQKGAASSTDERQQPSPTCARVALSMCSEGQKCLPRVGHMGLVRV